MSETLVQAVLSWTVQHTAFARDGSLRDIYVQNASIGDWKLVVGIVQRGAYGARLSRAGVDVAMPASFESLFDDSEERYFLSFTVAGVGLDCHFFTPDEIELSFGPEDISEASLHGLLAFMIELGDATSKAVIMTPENFPQSPFFRYDPAEQQLGWLASNGLDGG